MLTAIFLLMASIASPEAEVCTMAASDRQWIDKAVSNWRAAERALLKLPERHLPGIYVADARCIYRFDSNDWIGKPHSGTLAFPAGPAQPVGPISFAAPAANEPTGGFFAMSLPSVWRAAGVTSELGLERLMDGVLLHESMHARQFYFVNPAMETLTERYKLPDDIGDDALQEHYKKDPTYVAAYEKERDTLFRAAAAATDVEARRLAAEGLALMRMRRARYFSGSDEKWASLDDLFLQMEGLGQWLAYAWYTSPSGANLPAAEILPAVRRGGRYWTRMKGWR